MEILKRKKLRCLSHIVSKLIIKPFYIWKSSNQSLISNRYQILSIGKHCDQDILNQRPAITEETGKRNQYSIKISSPNSVFEELKASLVIKAKSKEKKSVFQDCESLMIVEQIKSSIIHKRSRTGNV